MPDPIVTVPVKLPQWVWGRLATIAEHRDIRVADIIADGIWQVLDNDPNRLAELEMEMRKRDYTPMRPTKKAAA